MKPAAVLALTTLLLAAPAVASETPVGGASVVFVFDSLKASRGEVMVALYDDQNAYKARKGSREAPWSSKSATITSPREAFSESNTNTTLAPAGGSLATAGAPRSRVVRARAAGFIGKSPRRQLGRAR